MFLTYPHFIKAFNIKPLVLTLLLPLVVSIHAVAQKKVYKLDQKKEAVVIAGGIGLLTFDLLLHYNSRPLLEAEINRLDPLDIHNFDRGAIENNSLTAQNRSDWYRNITTVLPFGLLALKPIRKDGWTVGLLYLETTLVNNSFTALVKNTIERTRPFVYNQDVPLEQKLGRAARKSFFSGHSSQTASMSFFGAKVFSDYYPDSRWKPAIWSLAVALPTMTSYLRVKAGKHFKTDVITGSVVGAAIGYLIPHLHKNKASDGISLGYEPQTNGISLIIPLN